MKNSSIPHVLSAARKILSIGITGAGSRKTKAVTLFTTFVAAIVLMTIAEKTSAQDPTSKHERSIQAIRKLGGEVKIDTRKPDPTVAVILLGAGEPKACLPYLKDVRNLQTCDL